MSLLATGFSVTVVGITICVTHLVSEVYTHLIPVISSEEAYAALLHAVTMQTLLCYKTLVSTPPRRETAATLSLYG